MNYLIRLFAVFAAILLLAGCSAHRHPPYKMPPQQTISPRPIPRPPAEPIDDQAAILLPKPFKKTLIVIDAGHGGEDFGTHSNIKPRYQEKHLNLATAKILKSYLEQLGYKTIMTRSDDTFIALDARAKLANAKKPAIFVSVHYNSAPSEDAQGVEVYYYNSDSDKARSSSSKEAAQAVLDKVIALTKAKSRGVKHGNFLVIRDTKMPAILIEGGFLTNSEEMQKLKDPDYMKKLAWGIAQGTDSYLRKQK